MLPSTIHIGKIWGKIMGGVAIIATLTGSFTLAGGIKWMSREVKTHTELDRIPVVETDVHHIQHFQEMSWEIYRLLTDNPDTIEWIFATEDGRVFDVDIRQTAEGIRLAFIYQTKMMYPVYFSHADNRSYILVHDIPSGERENFLLYKKQK